MEQACLQSGRRGECSPPSEARLICYESLRNRWAKLTARVPNDRFWPRRPLRFKTKATDGHRLCRHQSTSSAQGKSNRISTCVRYEITTKRLCTLTGKKYAVRTKEHTTYSRSGTIILHRNTLSHDIQAINKPWNQQTFTITSHYRRPDVNDPVTSMDL